jgi:ATP-binding cassette subfamily F protein 3
MLLVSLTNVSFGYGVSPVLEDIDLEITDGQRIGIVGENGSGKSTLLRLIAGLEAPSPGTVARARHVTIGYLPQESDPLHHRNTIFDAVAAASSELVQVEAELRRLEARVADPSLARDSRTAERLLHEFGAVQTRFEALGGYEVEHRVAAVLTGLGFSPEQALQEVRTLSGGEKKFVSLARLLVQTPDLLLLDEPDNHLDLDAKAWLETFIATYKGAVLLISHDRYLLDRVATRVLGVEDGQVSDDAGNYSYYVDERQRRLARQHAAYTDEQEEIKRLEASLRQLKQWARINSDFAPRAESMERRVERARQAARARPTLRRERIKVDFSAARSGTVVLEAKRVSKTLGGRSLFRPFDLLIRHGERVGVVGPNGSGKTTLLDVLTGRAEPNSGTVRLGASVVLGHYAQEQETLPFDRTPLDFVQGLKPIGRQGAIGVLRRLLFTYQDAFTPIAKLSGGEKSRLQLARLMLTDANFLVLDEPTNNLDIPSIEALEAALDDFAGTVLAVSHDRYFLDTIVGRIVALHEGGDVQEYPGTYSDYHAAIKGTGS